MKITLDTNVLLRAHQNSHGPATALLKLILERHELVWSQSMSYELEEALHYPQVRRMTQLTDEQIVQYVELVAKSSRLVDLGKPRPFALNDVDDWMVVRTAIAGEVQVLCTLDEKLISSYMKPVFESYDILVMTDVALLKLLRSR